MKKSVLTLLLFCLIALVAVPIIKANPNFSKNTNHFETLSSEDRQLSGFSKIDVSGAFHVRIIKSNTYAVKVEAEERDMSKIITEVKGDKLIIRFEKNGKSHANNSGKKNITIQTPNLNALNCSGAVEVESTDIFDANKFELKTSGATEVEIGINAKLLISKFSGATEVKLKGTVDTHALEMTGASELKALELLVNKYAIDTKGAAECEINVKDELSVSGTGASSIKYKGSPSRVSKDSKGAFEITKL